MTERVFSLRRSASPYLSLGAIFVGIAVWISVGAFRKHDIGTIESSVFLLAIYAVYVFIGTRYRITVRDSTIIQRAFGKSTVSIPIGQINSAGSEISDVRTLVQMNRPFRRIVIRSIAEGHAVKIDISTKHFLKQDIQKLMRLIHNARPDLALPALWLTDNVLEA